MRTYLSLFRIKFIANLQYRAAALAGVFTQLFFGLVFILVYLAFYESNPTTSAPMPWNDLVSYLWLNQILFSLTYIWVRDRDLLDMIKNGNVAYEMCRPISFYWKWFFTMYGSRLANVLLRFIPVTIIAFLLPSPYTLGLPKDFNTFLVFILALIIASLLVTSLSFIYHLITFFTLDEKGVITFLMVFGEIFAGGTIPLVFFPKFLYNIAYILPFRYICDLPFRIYSGNISIVNALPDVVGALIWLICLIILGLFIAKLAMKKATIQGG